LALDPRDPDALELRGTLNYWRSLINLVDHAREHDVVDRADDDLRAASETNPRPASAFASLSHLLLNNGDVAGSKLFAVRSYESDPFLANANLTLWRLASTSWELGTATESRKWCEEGLSRFPNDFRFRQCQLMLFGLPGYPANIPRAWELLSEFTALAPPPVRELSEKQGHMYLAWALTRANLPDSAHAVALRGRAGPGIDPLHEVAWAETILRLWLARHYSERGRSEQAEEQYDIAIRQLGLFLAANPSVMEGFRADAQKGHIDKWYLEGLVTNPGFRALVGAR
jgi:tetratricopeptide (TPR) repeat protein